MLTVFRAGCADLNRLGASETAALNFGVHMLLRVAASSAVWNALALQNRPPREDYWDAVCRDIFDKACADMAANSLSLMKHFNIEHDRNTGEWRVVPAKASEELSE